MDLSLLEKALEDDSNYNLIETNIQEIKDKKNNILQQLSLDRVLLKEYHKKLKEYMYVDSIEELKEGHVLRYINLNNLDNINLSASVILCSINMNKKGIAIVVKIFNNKHITLFLDKILLFKKFSNSEKILLNAIKLLNK
tara:strand:+ start:6531 stop:6950 length:420 start_codon:yes stop_codon:yes gene_type:complete